MYVKVFASQSVTPTNPNGEGLIDLDSPEGQKIFGGQESVETYKAERKILSKMRELAIEALKKEGELPPDYQAIGGE